MSERPLRRRIAWLERLFAEAEHRKDDKMLCDTGIELGNAYVDLAELLKRKGDRKTRTTVINVSKDT